MDATPSLQVGARWEKTGPINTGQVVWAATNHHAAHKRLYRHGIMWTLFAVLVYLTTFSLTRQTHVELTPPRGDSVFNWADVRVFMIQRFGILSKFIYRLLPRRN